MEYRFDFDDQLPDLPIAFDFEEVADLFERKVFAPNAARDPVGRFVMRVTNHGTHLMPERIYPPV